MKLVGRDHKKPLETHYLPDVNLIHLFPQSNVNIPASSGQDQIGTLSKPIQSPAARSRRYWFLGLLVLIIISVLIGRYYMAHSPSENHNHETMAAAQDSSELVAADRHSDAVQSEEAIVEACVIITGTFGQHQNARDMLNQISYLGYESYEAAHDGLLRVGIRFDCVEGHLDSMILLIRDQISDKAWYLIPNYEPDL